MPAAAGTEIQQALEQAFIESGKVAFRSGDGRPLLYLIADEFAPASVWIYVWTLTPGGRPSLPNEFRIQMTSVTSPLPLNPQGMTLLLGYEPSLQVFAGFDLLRHRTFTGTSPSVQVDREVLRQALQDGLAFDRKENAEIAIGIRPDHLWEYAINAASLHEASNGDVVALLEVAAKGVTPSPEIVDAQPEERKRLVFEVARNARKASFRKQVLAAYESRCAVTRWQMGLVEAAHILPVEAGADSIDHVTNGIALSPTFHLAFDRSLIYLTVDYEMRLNPRFVERVQQDGLAAGLEALQASLGRIHLPHDTQQRPSPTFILKANTFRKIQA
jgi:putative restriction endonuclease